MDSIARDESPPARRTDLRSERAGPVGDAKRPDVQTSVPEAPAEAPPTKFDPAALNDTRFDGTWNRALPTGLIGSLQVAAGNRAVQGLFQGQDPASAARTPRPAAQAAVQRALGGLLGHGTSVADALKSKDPGDVKDVWLEDIKMASHSDKMALVRILAYQGWVGPRDRSKLEEIWGTLSTPQLVSVVSTETILWNHCASVASGLADLPAVKEAAKDFKSDISTKALYFLGQNRTVVEKEMARFGMIPTTDPNLATLVAPAAPNEESKKQLKEIQQAAQLVKHYQTRLQEMSKVLVGKGFQPFNPDARPVEDILVGADMAGLYGRDKQDEQPGYTPNDAPNSTQSPIATVDPRAGKKGTWDLVKEQWDFVKGRIASIGNAYPTIFASLNAGAVSIDDLATTDPDKDPQKASAALRNVQTVMNGAFRNIDKATKSLDQGRTNPLDLKPVYEQVLAGLTVGGGSGRDWKSPFNTWVGRHEVKDHKQTEAYIALALEAAEFAVFVASVVGTGGASTFLALSAASVGVPGVKAALSADKYDTLAAANQGQVRGDLAIVDKKDVDLAKMAAEQDAMMLKVAVLTTLVNGIAHGMTEAAAVKAAKESGAAVEAKGTSAGPGGKPGECFVAGTPVLTPDGPRAIETLRAGAVVLAHDLADATLTEERVTASFRREVSEVLDIEVGPTRITCSPTHPFWVPGAGWRPAGDLEVGTPLRARDGSAPSVSSITARHGSFPVFNLEVGGVHTYLVGEAGILVHNKAGVARVRGEVLYVRPKARNLRDRLASRPGPEAQKMREQADKHLTDLDRIEKSYIKADEAGNEAELKNLTDQFDKVTKSLDKLEDAATRQGVTVGNVRFYPEAQYLTTGKHGVQWKEGKVLAAGGTAQGQFGSAADVDLGVQMAARNAATIPADGATLPIVGRHSMVVHMPNGDTVPATSLYVKIYPEAKGGIRLVHMSPRP